MRLQDLGKHGGTVLRGFPGAAGKVYNAGDELSAADVESWPVANRHALESTGYVQWHAGSPEQPTTTQAEPKGAARQRV